MTTSPRILFISNRGLLPIKDGHTRRSYNILKGLTDVFQVHYISLYEDNEEINPQNINELKKICRRVEFFPAPSKRFGIQMLWRLLRSLVSKDPYTIWRHYSASFCERVDSLISSGEFELIHCDILPLAYTVRNKKNTFISLTDHDVSYLKCLRMGQESNNPMLKLFLYFEAWKIKKLESEIFKQTDLGIVVSELDMKILQKSCTEGRFIVIENGVETDKFIPDNNMAEMRRIVWLGGFDHYPNQQGIYFFLKDIYPKIKQDSPDIQFDAIGGGITDRLRNLAYKDKSINLLGYVDDPLPYIQKATVFVVPILSGGGTRLKVLEAMSAGKAIVGTSVGCEGINGNSGEHFIIADDATIFAQAVIRLLKDDSYRKYLGLNARKLVENYYDYKAICSKLNEAYKKAIEAHSRSQRIAR